MLQGQLSEEDWQNFFNEHDWVLGGIFDVQILGKTISQPHLKGANVDGRGFKRGDFLLNTKGHSKFSAIAEIKKPTTELLTAKPYRGDDAYSMSTELNGGVAQLRSYLYTWEIEGSRQDKNKDILEGNKVYTIQPKGILIIGHLSQLADSRDKLLAFELFRQNQKDILIVTFDEVFERAEHILNAH